MLMFAVCDIVKCSINVSAIHNVIKQCIIGINLTALVASGCSGYKLFCGGPVQGQWGNTYWCQFSTDVLYGNLDTDLYGWTLAHNIQFVNVDTK